MIDKIPFDTNTVQGRLLMLMQMRGLNKSDLAKIAGVKPQAVTHWFNRGEVGKASAVKIAAETDVSVDWILEGGAELHELNTHRSTRLKEWFKEEFPDKDKIAFQDLISGSLPFTDKTARRIENDYGMPYLYLDSGFSANQTSKLTTQDGELLFYFHKLPNESKEEFLNAIKDKADFFDRMFDELSKLRKLK